MISRICQGLDSIKAPDIFREHFGSGRASSWNRLPRSRRVLTFSGVISTKQANRKGARLAFRVRASLLESLPIIRIIEACSRVPFEPSFDSQGVKRLYGPI